MFSGGWENVWHDQDGLPVEFATKEEADAEIKQHLADCEEAVKAGYLECAPLRDEYRIVEIQEVVCHT